MVRILLRPKREGKLARIVFPYCFVFSEEDHPGGERGRQALTGR